MSTLVAYKPYFIVSIGSLISDLFIYVFVQSYFSPLFCSYIFCFYFWVWQWKTNKINHSHPLFSLWFKCLKFLRVCRKSSYLFGLILIYLQTSFCFFSNYVHLSNVISRGHDHSFILHITSFHDFITLLLWGHTCSGSIGVKHQQQRGSGTSVIPGRKWLIWQSVSLHYFVFQ